MILLPDLANQFLISKHQLDDGNFLDVLRKYSDNSDASSLVPSFACFLLLTDQSHQYICWNTYRMAGTRTCVLESKGQTKTARSGEPVVIEFGLEIGVRVTFMLQQIEVRNRLTIDSVSCSNSKCCIHYTFYFKEEDTHFFFYNRF